MGRRAEPLRFVCQHCGAERETYSTSNKGMFCDRACRAAFRRKGRDQPGRYRQGGTWMLRWNEGGTQRHQYEHRRIWETVHGPIPEGYEVLHINGDRYDNRIENLECRPWLNNHERRRFLAGHAQSPATRKAVE